MTELRELSAIWGPPGFEQPVADRIAALIGPYVDHVRRDALGNLIATRGGRDGGRRVMVTAHMDQMGLLVTHVTDSGFLRVVPVGACSPAAAKSQRVQFRDGRTGLLEHEPVEQPKDLNARKLFVDVGAAGAAEVAAMGVAVGDVCTPTAPFAELGTRLAGPAMDGRAACAAVIAAARQLQDAPRDHHMHFVFTVQEETGPRGARTAAFGLEPDLAVVVDVSPAGDVPGVEPEELPLGRGVAIKVKDRGFIAAPAVREWLVAAARAAGVPHQFEVGHRATCEAGGIQVSRAGVCTGALSIPCRYHHTPGEMIDRRDLEACQRLLAAALGSALP